MRDQALLACVPDHEGEIAFEALQAFEPALTVDGKSQRGIAVCSALQQRQRRQVQTRAQILAVVEPAHQHGAQTGNCRLRHQGRTIRVAMIAHAESVSPSRAKTVNPTVMALLLGNGVSERARPTSGPPE